MASNETSATFVIIGGGIAGVSCLEGLNFLCSEEKIIMVTSSPLVKTVTNVVPITKTLTHFDVQEKNTDTLMAVFPNLTVIQDSVCKLDSEQHTITTKGGEVVKYKKLCICAGGYPKLIKENNPYVLGIRDTESVKDFEERIGSARRIVVVGNGGIATEIVHEVEGIDIIWVIKDRNISAAFVDPGASEFFQPQLTKDVTKKERKSADTKRMKYTIAVGDSGDLGGAALGPDWHTGFNIPHNRNKHSKVTVEYECEVKKIIRREEIDALENGEKDWSVYVELTNGKMLGCDFVVSATGVMPNSCIFVEGNENFEIAEDGGLKVDWKMETSIPDVFAAGDVCSAAWQQAQHWFQMRLWTQARQMGTYAAKTMAASLNSEQEFQDFCFELFSHVTYFFGYKVVLLGLFKGQKLDSQYEILLRVTKGVEYVKLVMKDGRMQGAVLIGETDLEEMCENLILNQLDLSSFGEDLLNPDIDIEDYFD